MKRNEAKQRALALCLCGVSLLALVTTARAQNLVQSSQAPPPLGRIAPAERAQLTRESDYKKRLRLSLQLSEARLRRAEELTGASRFEAATDELATYQELLEDALAFLRARGKTDGKARDLYKYLELNVRPHGTRLEAIRRATPAEYAVHVKAIFDFTRDLRTEALNSFYGDTVLKDPGEVKGEATGSSLQPRPREP